MVLAFQMETTTRLTPTPCPFRGPCLRHFIRMDDEHCPGGRKRAAFSVIGFFTLVWLPGVYIRFSWLRPHPWAQVDFPGNLFWTRLDFPPFRIWTVDSEKTKHTSEPSIPPPNQDRLPFFFLPRRQVPVPTLYFFHQSKLELSFF